MLHSFHWRLHLGKCPNLFCYLAFSKHEFFYPNLNYKYKLTDHTLHITPKLLYISYRMAGYEGLKGLQGSEALLEAELISGLREALQVVGWDIDKPSWRAAGGTELSLGYQNLTDYRGMGLWAWGTKHRGKGLDQMDKFNRRADGCCIQHWELLSWSPGDNWDFSACWSFDNTH